MEKYKDWLIFDSIPDGWIVDKTAGSPAPNTVFITNGKSVLKGQKRALLKVKSNYSEISNNSKTVVAKKEAPKQDYTFPAESVNILARKKFELKLMQEINFDLMVCQIEGWDKKEYINELKSLIDDVYSSFNNKAAAGA